MHIRVIAAVSEKDNGVGFQNTIPWKQKADMDRFKHMTQEDGVIIMGFNTFKSFKGYVLPKRIHIVLSDISMQSTNDRVVYVESLPVAIELGTRLVKEGKGSGLSIIGGPRLWREGVAYADILNLSYIKTDNSIQFDTFFPEIDMSVWKEVGREFFKKDTENDFDYQFVDYVRV